MTRKVTLKYAIVAAVLSLGFHMAVIGTAERFDIAVLSIDKNDEQEEEDNPINLSTVDVRERVKKNRPESVDETEAAETLASRVSERKLKNIFKEEGLVDEPEPELEVKGIGEDVEVPDKKSGGGEPQEASAPRPSIVSIDADSLPAGEGNEASRQRIAKKDRKQVSSDKMIPSLVEEGPLQSGQGGKYQASMQLSLPSAGSMEVGEGPGELNVDENKTEAKQMEFQEIEDTGAPSVSSSTAGDRERTEEEVQHMRKLLNVSLVTSEDSDGGGTFRIDISPNPKSDLLGAISKDILFVIDSSTSVSPRKFRYFKSATREALEYLHPDDRFNIVSFKVQPNRLFSQYRPVNERNLQNARSFLDNVSRGGLTDVYGGLAPCIKNSRASGDRPAVVFLMTDGQSTVKDKPENDELIRKIVDLNEANASIYCFSTGNDVNRFLLDFLAYSNRGTALHVDKIKKFEDRLSNFIRRHSELIVQNLTFDLSGHVTGTIYPKELPHLYRDEVLSIYGRFKDETENVGIRLTGKDSAGKLSELVYKGDVADAQAAESDLRLDWASQKVFHLIAQRTLHPEKKGINARIRTLAKKYNLYVPYL